MAVVNAPYRDIETYRNLNDTLKKAVVGISFWGNRYIYAEGCKGYCPLVDPYRRIYRLEKHDNPEGKPCYTPDERVIGKEIVLLVTQLSDKKISNSPANTMVLLGVLVLVGRSITGY